MSVTEENSDKVIVQIYGQNSEFTNTTHWDSPADLLSHCYGFHIPSKVTDFDFKKTITVMAQLEERVFMIITIINYFIILTKSIG